MPITAPFTTIRNQIRSHQERSQERRQEEQRARITQMAEAVNIPLDQLDLSSTGRDWSRTKNAPIIAASVLSAGVNLAAAGATFGVTAPINVPVATLNLAQAAGFASKKGNSDYKGVNAALLERTDADDVRYGAVKKYFSTQKQAKASVQAGMEKLDYHLQESPEAYRERILSGDQQTVRIPGLGAFDYGHHHNERQRLNLNLPSHGDGRVYSVPFYAGGKSSLIIKTTSREKALELREQAQTNNGGALLENS